MLRWTTLPVVVCLLLVSLDGSIGATLPRTGVRPQLLPGHIVPSGELKTNSLDAHSGHAHQQEPHIPSITPSKGQKGTPVNGVPEANNPVRARRPQVTHGFKGLDRKQDPHKNISAVNPKGTESMPQSNVIAFTVSNDGPQQGPYPDVKFVTFNKVITNIGGGFDPFTSSFTCKVSGLYFFSVSLLSSEHHQAWIYLVHDGKNVVDAYGCEHYVPAVGTVLKHLTAGSKVWITLKQRGETNNYAVSGTQGTFSGYLVKPDMVF